MHQKLQYLAQLHKMSMAEYVREIVAKELQSKEKSKRSTSVLLTMATNAQSSAVGDLAKNHDIYLYGKKK